MSVSLCVLRVEVDEELPEMGDSAIEAESARESKKRDRGARESRTITVETYARVAGGGGGGPEVALLPTSTRRLTETTSEAGDDTISFFCGNPLVEVTKGVLHIYKENELKEASAAEGAGASVLCLLAVPAALGARDLLAFAAACQQDIAHVRVLRDGSPAHYMALITFRSGQAAREFHSAFDGVPYSSLEPGALCHTAWVSRVEWARDGTPPPSHTELPTCPVCLERMDESVAGVLSVQCAHAFHADCLLGWGDASCPVCRCSQTPEPLDRANCFECERLQQERDSTAEPESAEERKENISGIAEGLLDGVDAGTLWICLICGHVGCGRYEAGHAAKHFRESNHTYALQLGSNRVWDYAGDNFVHRLVQNKSDGKLVAAGEGGEREDGAGCGPTGDKLDSAQLEFTYILTQQLDHQRQFYEDRIARIESEHSAECEELRTRAARADTAAAAFRERLHTLTKENKTLDKKLHNNIWWSPFRIESEHSAECEELRTRAARADTAAAAFRERLHTLTKENKTLDKKLHNNIWWSPFRIESEHSAECEELRTRAARADTAAAAFRERLHTLTKENKTLDKKLHQVTSRLSSLQSELSEERGLATAMAGSQAAWQEQAKSREEAFQKEVTELKEQLRDVMFFVEARGQLENTEQASSEELAGATVTVAPAHTARSRRAKR